LKTIQLGSYIKITAVISVVVGLLVIIGWLTGDENLKSVIVGLATMKFNAAICFVFCGIALFLLAKNGRGTRYYQIALLLIVLSIGLISFCQYIFNFNSGLDELFIKDRGTAIANFPGRMAASTAFCFLLLSLASIAILLAGNSVKRTAQYALHFVSLVAFVALIGYLYDIPNFYKLSFFQSMALSTSILFFILSIAVSLLNPYSIIKLFTGKSTSSIMAKKLFPLFTIIILVLGFVRLELHHLNIVSEDFGIALFATSSIIVCLVLTTITAKYLDKMDAKRSAAEESLRSLNLNLQELVDKRTADLQQTTERLSLATQGSKIGIWDWDIVNDKLTWDDITYQLYNLDPNTFPGAYEAWEHVVHPEDKEPARHAVNKAIAGGSEFNNEFRVIWPDKSVHHVKAKGVVQRDTTGKAIRMVGTNWDISDRIMLQKKLEEQKEQNQKIVLITAIESQEKERKQIGFELNENVNQILTAANMHLGFLKNQHAVPPSELIDEASLLIKKAIEGIDKITRNIGNSYIEDIGLKDALNDLVHKMNALHIFKAELQLSIEGIHIPAPGELTIYRFVQEQLNNILQYAEASQVAIQLHSDGDLLALEISDNGKGAKLDEIKKGVGLSIMQNRTKAYNGKVEFDTSPGKGFKVMVKLPYKQPET